MKNSSSGGWPVAAGWRRQAGSSFSSVFVACSYILGETLFKVVRLAFQGTNLIILINSKPQVKTWRNTYKKQTPGRQVSRGGVFIGSSFFLMCF